MTPNRQLSAFYKKQGLTGKHLRSALKHDRKLVLKNTRAENTPQQMQYLRRHPYGIESLFHWSSTPEGHDYWAPRAGY